jgi:integrase/recombinase XerD
MTRHTALKMIQRRALKARVNTPVCCHSFRATGITNHPTKDGTLEDVQYLAGHAESRTTGLYEQRKKKVTRNIVERISILKRRSSSAI